MSGTSSSFLTGNSTRARDAEDEWWKDPAMGTKPSLPAQSTGFDSQMSARNTKSTQADSCPYVSSSRSSEAPTQEWWDQMDEKRQQQVAQETGFSRPPSSSLAALPSQAERMGEKRSVFQEESERITGLELPPPYTAPKKDPVRPVRLRAAFPAGYALASQFRPSPGSVAPDSATARGVGSQNRHLTDLPHENADMPLPDRPTGTYVPAVHGLQPTGAQEQREAEMKRRRREREDLFARRLGYFSRTGPEGRKRRRMALGVCGGILGVIALGVVLVVTLTHKKAILPLSVPTASNATAPTQFTPTNKWPTDADVPWLNLTGFPPVPTGVFTVIGPDSTKADSSCVQPSTLWTCSLPPEMQSKDSVYGADRPLFIFQIQYDNSSSKDWNVTGQAVPTPTSARLSTASRTYWGVSAPTGDSHVKRDPVVTDADSGFHPVPAPPNFQEMWFLGNTTDNIAEPDKAGEPTPFYMSVLTSVNATAGNNVYPALSGRGLESSTAGAAASAAASASDDGGSSIGGTIFNLGDYVPAPRLNSDGTSAAAVPLPFPYQQPLRLFDRGQPTEHYGFYSYYNKTLYVSSTSSAQAPDADGGAQEKAASALVTWGFVRYKVVVWTRFTASLLHVSSSDAVNSLTRPGTFPYPVRVSLDLHGGPANTMAKGAWSWGLTSDQRVDKSRWNYFQLNLASGGTLVNGGNTSHPNLSWGGINGGNGGCKCEYVNYAEEPSG